MQNTSFLQRVATTGGGIGIQMTVQMTAVIYRKGAENPNNRASWMSVQPAISSLIATPKPVEMRGL
jgi:hypothetical protein